MAWEKGGGDGTRRNAGAHGDVAARAAPGSARGAGFGGFWGNATPLDLALMAALALVLAAWGCSTLSQRHALSRGGHGGGGGGGSSGGGPGGRHHTGAVGRIGGGFHGAGLLDFAEHDKSQGVFSSLGAGVYGGIGQALGVRAVHDSSQGSSAFGRAGGNHQRDRSRRPARRTAP